jgi:hypothetical protein
MDYLDFKVPQADKMLVWPQKVILRQFYGRAVPASPNFTCCIFARGFLVYACFGVGVLDLQLGLQ